MHSRLSLVTTYVLQFSRSPPLLSRGITGGSLKRFAPCVFEEVSGTIVKATASLSYPSCRLRPLVRVCMEGGTPSL